MQFLAEILYTIFHHKIIKNGFFCWFCSVICIGFGGLCGFRAISLMIINDCDRARGKFSEKIESCIKSILCLKLLHYMTYVEVFLVGKVSFYIFTMRQFSIFGEKLSLYFQNNYHAALNEVIVLIKWHRSI